MASISVAAFCCCAGSGRLSRPKVSSWCKSVRKIATDSMDVYEETLLREMAGISIFQIQLAMPSFSTLLENE